MGGGEGGEGGRLLAPGRRDRSERGCPGACVCGGGLTSDRAVGVCVCVRACVRGGGGTPTSCLPGAKPGEQGGGRGTRDRCVGAEGGGAHGGWEGAEAETWALLRYCLPPHACA